MTISAGPLVGSGESDGLDLGAGWIDLSLFSPLAV